MNKMIFSMNDTYPMSSAVLSTTEQTIPSHDDANYAVDNEVSQDGSNMTVVNSNKSMVWGGLLLLFGLLVALHFIGE